MSGRRWCGVDFVSVMAVPADSPKKILASAFTDEKGRFEMTVTSESDSIVLKASGLEIEPAQVTVPNRAGVTT